MVDDEATMKLLRLIVRGEREALDQLLARHRDRLRQMIAVRMDARLSARVFPSLGSISANLVFARSAFEPLCAWPSQGR